MKQYKLYILSAACFLTACSTDYFEPGFEATDESGMLSISVSVADVVASDTISTRASESLGSTVFRKNDTIGLIILDGQNRVLADNVPYIYDGSKWNFCADNKEGKQPVYYDAEMNSYIVYFPYTSTANGCQSVDQIKKLDRFEYRSNQRSRDDYYNADVLVWTHTGSAIREINATMNHICTSFTFYHPKIKWKLVPTGESLVYEALQNDTMKTLKDFRIEYHIEGKDPLILFQDNKESDLTYHDSDNSYRYILPEEQKGTIKWQYTYRDITFRGEREIPEKATGTRFLHEETADMGDLPGLNMQISDLYCSLDPQDKNIGYVFPWDAAMVEANALEAKALEEGELPKGGATA